MSITTRVLRLSILSVAVFVIASAAKADTTLYTDGPTLGTNFGWTINFGFQVEDSFALSSASTLNSVTFGNWLFPGDTASSVDWAIVGSEGNQTPVCGSCSGTASLSGAFDFTNGDGFDVYDETFSLPSLNLAAGTYWLELQNEVVTNGDPAYWDANGGPSMIWESQNGDQSGNNCETGSDGPGSCSDSFTINGTNSTGVTPEPSSLALLVSGITLLGAEIRRRRIL